MFLSPAALFVAYVRLSAISGVVLALPIMLYQVWAFVAPGLYSKEKRLAIPFVVSSCGLFAGGGYFSLAYIARMTRSFMLDQLRQEYIIAARVKGVSEARVIWRHALGNVMVPLITVVALAYANLLEGSVLTETVFAWPGLGQYVTNSLLNADMNAVLGGTIVVGTIFIGLNLLSDVLYRLVDPRAR